MKNKEKYSEGILKLFKYQGSVTKDGVVGFCDYTSCGDCIFSSHNCGKEMRTEWLEQEYKEAIVLTEDEKAILRSLNEKWKWIARDKNGKLCLFQEKPYKCCTEWHIDAEFDFYPLPLFSHLFQSIKWEDEEPYLIEDLLNES